MVDLWARNPPSPALCEYTQEGNEKELQLMPSFFFVGTEFPEDGICAIEMGVIQGQATCF